MERHSGAREPASGPRRPREGGSPAPWIAGALALIAGIGWADWATGYEVSVALFYLLPIGVVAMRAGRAAGMLAAGAAGLTWYLADAAVGQHYTSAWYLYWNTGIRFGMFLVVAVALAELRAAFERERAQRASLEELHRLKNEFLGMAAHDLRTPIAVVQIYADLLLGERNGALTARQKALLEVIRRKGRFMLDLVSDLLDVARIESGRLELRTERRDYGAFLREKLAVFEALGAQREVAIRAEIEAGLPAVPFDRDRIEQVVDNLVFNGLKYSPRGGTLLVTARRAGDGIETAVADEGPGIPPEEAESVFRAFHRVSSGGVAGDKGTGLGLAIARRIVEAHGGRITAGSGAGGGARIVFLLPLSPGGAPLA